MSINTSKEMMNRRNLFKAGSLILGSLGISAVTSASKCFVTAQQPEGPFYPQQDQLDKNNDLTRVMGRNQRALGEIVYLSGVVTDTECRPLKNAVVEIWQACYSGKYNHTGDPNDAPLDPNFQYWGRTITNDKGEYIFKTVKPGSYQASSTWRRPPHIHMKVHRRGFDELTTQIYFHDEQDLNSRDLILTRLPSMEQAGVVIDFNINHQQNKMGIFNISLKPIN